MRNILPTGFAAVAIAVSAIAAPAVASPVYDTPVTSNYYSDSRALHVQELQSGGATTITSLNLGWNIGYNVGTSLWTYTYTMTWTPTGANNISHFVLDLSDDCTSAASNCVIGAKVSGANPKDTSYSSFNGTQPSNPGMGGPIAGVKFDMPDQIGATPFSLTFQSERAPVWGDFYTKAGNITNAGWYSQNVGIASSVKAISTNIDNFIARPNGVGGPPPGNPPPGNPPPGVTIPEPMSMTLFGIGLVGLAATRLRRRTA